MSVQIEAIVAVAVAALGLISTFLGMKYQKAMSVAASKTAEFADLAVQANKVIVAAKDCKVDEVAFQVIVDDLHKIVNP